MTDTTAPNEPQPPVAADAAAASSPAACLQELKALFPALFGGAAKPLKLRIQADIQERAPGKFSKQQLSGALRRLTGSTSYLIALSKATQRFDLDGQAAGELAAEHRDAAVAELARRRELNHQRREQELSQRRERAALLRSFETTTLTRGNFCALKGIDEAALDALLEQARREVEEDRQQRAAAPAQRQRPGGPDQRRGPRRDEQQRRPKGPRPQQRQGQGPRGEAKKASDGNTPG